MLHRRLPRHTSTDLDTRNLRLGLSTTITALILSALALTRTERGTRLLGETVRWLEYYVGVFTLVTLTTTVALGLIATERSFLSAPNRVRAQLAHRAAAVLGVGFLLTHLVVKISAGLAPPLAAVLPFAGPRLYVSLGALASDLMIVVVLSGLLRGRFAGTGRPWLWRVLHGAAYLAWPIAIMHGLTAGRAAADWVNWSYVACLAAVCSALLIRALATFRRPPAVPEPVEVPVAEQEHELVQPISLDTARRKLRESA